MASCVLAKADDLPMSLLLGAAGLITQLLLLLIVRLLIILLAKLLGS